MTEKILYKAGKPGRGTTFEIYTDGRIIINRKLTLTSIHIPARIQNWMDIVRSSRGNKNTIRITIIEIEKNQNYEIVSNQIVTLEKKTNGWFLEFSNTNEIKKIISQNRDSKITCIISGLIPTKLFYKKRDLLKNNNIIEEKNIQWFLGSKNRGSSFNVYLTNTKQLQIESYCWLGKSGQIELSQELWRYIKDWWKLKNRYVIGAINDGTKSVLKFSQRKKKKRLVKKITIPYNGKRKKIKVVFTHPVFELSENAKNNLTLTKELQQAGYNIKKLTTNWTDKPRHIDEEFEEKVWNILKCAFAEENSKIFSEVKITTAFTPKITKCIDGLFVCKEILGLIELKTSENIKNSELDEVIGELLLLQENISEKMIVTLLFINTEVTTTEQSKTITKLYGLANNILLIGKEEVGILTENPMLLRKRLNEFLQVKYIKQNQLMHPINHTLTIKETLEREAYELLEQLNTNPNKSNTIIEQYCFLMNILKSDFLMLYNKFRTQQNEEDGRTDEYPTQQVRPTNRFFDEHTLKMLHKELSLNDNLLLLEERRQKEKHKKDYEILLEQWTTIMKVLPPMVRIIQLKPFFPKKGVIYEEQTRQELEQKGFTVISNILISKHGKQFEIDHLAIKNNQVTLISCKDRSHFQELPNLYSKIAFAYGWVFLYSKALNNVKGKLFIRVKQEYLEVLQERYKDYTSNTNSLLVTN